MALLRIIPTPLPSKLHSSNNTGNNYVIGTMTAPSLRMGFHVIKCAKVNGPVPPSAVTTDTISTTVVSKSVPVTPVVRVPGTVKRSDFPADFLFGVGSSALQTEGAYNVDGKGLSIWDTFTKEKNLASIDVACDSYHRYKEDIELLQEMGVKSYRFSISWPRILPKGNLAGGINQKGIDHYNDVINELIKHGIEPVVTVFHFDFPQGLQDLYGGLLSRRFINDFKDYADICFKNFGDRVKTWILINEKLAFARFGHDLGISAPGRGSPWNNTSTGNSAREPYIVTHNLILAQATAARLYNQKYKAAQGGQVGTALMASWILPHSDSIEDQIAAERARDFKYGWFLNPLLNGEYPTSMRYLVRDRLPTFTDEEKEMVKGSLDFVGLNYYTTGYVKHIPITSDPPVSYDKDSYTESHHVDSNGVSIGPVADGSLFVRIYPDGLRQILVYLSEKYQIKKLIVAENGTTSSVEKTPDFASAYPDQFRIKYMKDHILAVKQAIQEGANVKGYFYWSLLDSFEFTSGYTVRFGIGFTDFKTLARHPKLSSQWYHNFLNE